MPTQTPHVGVRTFLSQTEAQPFIIADMSTIGGVFTPGTGIDRSKFPVNTPVHFLTNDAEMVTAAGTGTLREQIDACTAEGIVASVVACVPDIQTNDTTDQKMAKMLGSSSSMTGIWAMLGALSETGVEPDILVAPGFTSTRPGNAANPIATAMDALSERIITAIGVCDVPSSNKEAAAEWAADFTETMNLVAIGQGVRVSEGGLPVVKNAAPHIASLIVRTDKEMGGPYYNPGNRALKGILGPSRSVNFSISDPDSEANWLLQRGVNSLVQIEKSRTSRSVNSPQGKTFWGFFNTSNDPLWRAINVVRTRKAVREVIPRTLVKYQGKNLGAHLAIKIMQSLDDFIRELESLPEPTVLGHKVTFDPNLNSNAGLRVGGLAIKLDFEEAPPLVDQQIYLGRYEYAFNILRDEITAAMSQYNVSASFRPDPAQFSKERDYGQRGSRR